VGTRWRTTRACSALSWSSFRSSSRIPLRPLRRSPANAWKQSDGWGGRRAHADMTMKLRKQSLFRTVTSSGNRKTLVDFFAKKTNYKKMLDWVLSLTHSKFYKTVMFIFLPTKDTTTVTLFDKNFSCGIAVAVFPLETEWPATANNRATVLPYLFIFQVRLKPVPQIFGGLCVPGM